MQYNWCTITKLFVTKTSKEWMQSPDIALWCNSSVAFCLRKIKTFCWTQKHDYLFQSFPSPLLFHLLFFLSFCCSFRKMWWTNKKGLSVKLEQVFLDPWEIWEHSTNVLLLSGTAWPRGSGLVLLDLNKWTSVSVRLLLFAFE